MEVRDLELYFYILTHAPEDKKKKQEKKIHTPSRLEKGRWLMLLLLPQLRRVYVLLKEETLA